MSGKLDPLSIEAQKCRCLEDQSATVREVEAHYVVMQMKETWPISRITFYECIAGKKKVEVRITPSKYFPTVVSHILNAPLPIETAEIGFSSPESS